MLAEMWIYRTEGYNPPEEGALAATENLKPSSQWKDKMLALRLCPGQPWMEI